MEYNQEHPTAEMIGNDIKALSEGAISLDTEWVKGVEMGHKSASHQKNAKRQQRPQQRQQQKNNRKNTQRHNSAK